MIPNTNRIVEIDALRGFALLGILTVNIFAFHAPLAHYTEFYSKFEGVEKQIIDLMVFFCGGKFMFIFAFLFGYGFWLQFNKYTDKKAFQKFWLQRMIVLFLFGALHLFFLSFGDILMPYAILGISLPFLAKVKPKYLLAIALLVFFSPVFEYLFRQLLGYERITMDTNFSLHQYIKISREGDFWDILKLRLSDYWSLRNNKLVYYIPKEFSLFILGLLAGKWKVIEKMKPTFVLPFLAITIIIIVPYFFFQEQIFGLFSNKPSLLITIPLYTVLRTIELAHGFLYVFGFLLICSIPFIKKIVLVLRYPGKMSLTNYISQSLICTVLLCGLNYYAALTSSQLIFFVILIFAFQIVFSFIWLRLFQFGPLEYVWRKLSYKNKFFLKQ